MLVLAGARRSWSGGRCAWTARAAQKREGALRVRMLREAGRFIVFVIALVDIGCGGGEGHSQVTACHPDPVGGEICEVASCDFTFDSMNAGNNPFCHYAGTATSRTCGTSPIGAEWQSDGATVTAYLGYPDGVALMLYATRTSAVTARVTASANSIDGMDKIDVASGALGLPSAKRFSAHVEAGFVCSRLALQGSFDTEFVP
jgi:hypothetical protein